MSRLRRGLLVFAGVLVAAALGALIWMAWIVAAFDGGGGVAPVLDRNRALVERHLEMLFGGALADQPLEGMRQIKTVYNSDLFILAPLPPSIGADGAFALSPGDETSTARLKWIGESLPDLQGIVGEAHRYQTDFLAEGGVEATVFLFDDPARGYLYLTDF